MSLGVHEGFDSWRRTRDRGVEWPTINLVMSRALAQVIACQVTGNGEQEATQIVDLVHIGYTEEPQVGFLARSAAISGERTRRRRNRCSSRWYTSNSAAMSCPIDTPTNLPTYCVWGCAVSLGMRMRHGHDGTIMPPTENPSV